MAVSCGDGHAQWENAVTHEIVDIVRSDIEVTVTAKLTNIISGALRSPQGEFPLSEFYYYVKDDALEIYDRNAAFLVSIGIRNFTDDEIEWIEANLPLFNISEDYQDESKIKLEFKKWKNEWWNVFRTNGNKIDLIGYVRPLLDHLILPFDIDSDGPTPRHYFEDRYDNIIVTEPEKKVINDFIMRQIGDISVADIYVTPENIEVYVLESAFINITVKPTYATNKRIYVESDNNEIAYVENNNVVNGLMEGVCNLVITSDEKDSEGNPLITKYVPINVIQLYELINTLYDIKVDSDTGNKYITGIGVDTKVHQFLETFRNNSTYIHVYTRHGNDVTYDSVEIMQTGMTVELEIDGTIYDHLDVVVPGDVNGDGLITNNDLTVFNKHYNNVELLSYPFIIAADINEDGIINTADRDMLINYINTGRF